MTIFRNRLPFTMEQALAMQESHLKQWDAILKPEVAAKLRERVLNENKGVTNPFEICRGSMISELVHNAAEYLDFA